MDEPLWAFLLKLLFPPLCAGFLASYVTYRLSHRRFILERWWDRKADTYAKIIGSLVALTYSLDRWVEDETAELSGRKPLLKTQRDDEVALIEYEAVRTQLERAATEGDYIISEKAANALSELIRQLQKAPEWSDPGGPGWTDWINCIIGYSKAAHDCLQAMRDEARSDLRVK
jgi:hypothetical protein